jgi:hypothetical protein
MKTLFTTKTFWAGLASIVTGAVGLFITGDKANGIMLISQGIGQIFLRSALLKKDNPSNN